MQYQGNGSLISEIGGGRRSSYVVQITASMLKPQTSCTATCASSSLFLLGPARFSFSSTQYCLFTTQQVFSAPNITTPIDPVLDLTSGSRRFSISVCNLALGAWRSKVEEHRIWRLCLLLGSRTESNAPPRPRPQSNNTKCWSSPPVSESSVCAVQRTPSNSSTTICPLQRPIYPPHTTSHQQNSASSCLGTRATQALTATSFSKLNHHCVYVEKASGCTRTPESTLTQRLQTLQHQRAVIKPGDS